MEVGVDPLHRDQLLVGATLHDAGISDHENHIRVADGGQVMRDKHRRPALHQASQRRDNRLLRRRIQIGRRLIQNQNRCIADDGPRNRDALALAA